MEALTGAFSGYASPTDTPLGSDFPGAQIMANLGLDPSVLVKAGFFLTILASAFGFLSNAWAGITSASRFLSDVLVSSASIQSSDESYVYLMKWFQTHKVSTDSRLFGVTSRKNTSSPSYQVHQWLYEGMDFTKDVDGSEKLEDDLGPKLKFTPSPGWSYFLYKGTLVIFQRVLKEDYYSHESPDESITLFTIGRSPAKLRMLLEDARQEYLWEQREKTLVYSTVATYPPSWSIGAPRVSRSLDTVIMKHEDKTALLKDMRDYLNPKSKKWYENRGLPYRRGYLFHGPPGTGKTSLSCALAGEFNLKLYVLSLGASTLSDEGLLGLFSTLPKKCIVVVEDVDSAGIGRENLMGPGGLFGTMSIPDEDDNDSDIEEKEKKYEQKMKKAAKNSSLSLSALLNAIDGIASQEGRILILTTNNREELDKALIRPGRVDLEMSFGLADLEILEQIFKAVYINDADDDDFRKDLEIEHEQSQKNSSSSSALSEKKLSGGDTIAVTNYKALVTKLAKEFASRIPSEKFTPAEVQSFLLSHKNDPRSAMKHLDDWLASKLMEFDSFEVAEKKKKAKREKAREKRIKEALRKKKEDERKEKKELEEIEKEEKEEREKKEKEEKERKEKAEKEAKEEAEKATKESTSLTDSATAEKANGTMGVLTNGVGDNKDKKLTNGVHAVTNGETLINGV